MLNRQWIVGWILRGALILWMLPLFSGSGLSEEFLDSNDTSSQPEQGNRLQISADSLQIDISRHSALFSGNVKVVHEDMVITADRLNVLFHKGFSAADTGALDEAAVKQITAQGNVSMRFGDRSARSDRAVYHIDKKSLILSGDPVMLEMGKNAITGSKITYYRTDGRIEVESKGHTRVEGLFYNEKPAE